MSCTKDYKNNFLSERPTTKVLRRPGGNSSAGSLIYGGDNTAPKESQKVPNQKEMTMSKTILDSLKRDCGEKSSQNKSEAKDSEPLHCQTCGNTHKSDAEKVREFTFEAGQSVPDKPTLMSMDEVNFITKMILDELLELHSTVTTSENAKNTMKQMLDKAKCIPKMNVSPNATNELIAEQGDAMVDIYYYSLNCMAKKGVNLSKIFELVHNANMAKRDPKTKKFIKRSDGKIIKPKGWTAPDVCAEIKNQIEKGAW